VVPASQLSVSPPTAHPCGLVTVTQTVTNNLSVVLLQPVAQLFSTPSDLTSYTTLVGCSGAVSCAVVNNGSGEPVGYQAALMNPLSALDGSSVSPTHCVFCRTHLI
jgi:hypothetical protein